MTIVRLAILMLYYKKMKEIVSFLEICAKKRKKE